MSINSVLPTELARHRQNINPPKTTLTSSHGVAYKSVRERKEALEIKSMEDGNYDWSHCSDIH